MSELVDAFDEALDSAEDAKGSREKVTFRGESIDALFGSQTDDLIMAPGGDADSVPITISVRLRDVVLPIAPLEPILVRGKDICVLHWDPREGRLDLTCGDPAAQLE